MFIALAFSLAPEALAKKDLFGNTHTNENSEIKSDSANSSSFSSLPVELPPPPEPEPTIVEMREQEAKAKPTKKSSDSLWNSTKNGLANIRDEIFDLKDHLLGKPKARKEISTTSLPQSVQTTAPEYTAYETKLSPTDAVKQALTISNGQVINLRKYQEGDKTLYNVKLLQKDGRMRSVVLDANTGEQLDDANEPTEE